MPPNNENSHAEIKRLLEENVALTKENNKLLKKVHRVETLSLVLKAVWFLVLIGIPFLLYFYLLEPYLGALRELYTQLPQGHFLKIFLEGSF